MVTSKNSEVDEVLSMSYGADDYITKPYNPTILLLRIGAVLKRAERTAEKLSYHDLEVIPQKGILKKQEQEIILTKNEMIIFLYLLQKQGKIVTRDELMTDLWNNNEYINDNNTTQEGYPIYSWYGYVADGYYQSEQDILDNPVYGGVKENVKPGYIKYKDISGPDGAPDGVIDDYDRTIIGDPQARYTFSLNLSAEWNNFDFSLFFQGVGKKDIFATGQGARPFWNGRTIFEEQLDYWTEDNRDAEYPLLLIDAAGTGQNNLVSSFWIKSGAYMRLKNATIGYTLPKKVLNKIKIDHVRFYLSGQNLFTISNGYPGYDPEGSAGTSYYPVMRVYTFGVDVRF